MTKSEFNILVVDDEETMRETLKELLERDGFSVQMADNTYSAIDLYQKQQHNLVISDIMMPESDGIELLHKLKNINPEVIVILITGYASIDSAVQAIKIGAEDYFTKPFNNEEILKVVDRIYKNQKLIQQNELLKQGISKHDIPEIVGNSIKIRKIISDIKTVANSDIPVFVSGESGTGKELVARAVHNLSERCHEPFVAINCAAIPNDLLESEFFGYEKGAFSGALTKKYGLFEIANNGTLFLDEIGEMPMALQAKLLRTIETQELRRIGGTKEVKINLRFVCCTNRDIKKEIEDGRFRSDLYYRLSTFCIHIPPLKDRKEDIPLIVNHFLNKKKGALNQLPDEIMQAFSDYNWPGNIRELEHVLERIILFAKDSPPSVKNLPNEFHKTNHQKSRTEDPVTELNSLKEIERTHILDVLNQCNGDKKEAAKILGIGLKTLYRKIEEYSYEDFN